MPQVNIFGPQGPQPVGGGFNLPLPATGPGITAQNPGLAVPPVNVPVTPAPAPAPQPVTPAQAPGGVTIGGQQIPATQAPAQEGTLTTQGGGATLASNQQQATTGTVTIPPELLPSGSNVMGVDALTYSRYVEWANANGYGVMPFDQWAASTGSQSTTGETLPPGSGGNINPNLQNLMEMLPPELLELLTINPNFQEDPDFRGNLFNLLAGAIGGGGPFELPGQGTDATAGFITNLLTGLVGQQGGRSSETEEILRGLIPTMEGSSANVLNEQALAGAQGLIAPGALDDLRAGREAEARQTAAAGLNTARNRLQDLGLAGMGAAGSGAINQAENLASQRLFQNLRAVDEQTERDRLQRLQLAGGLAGQGADITRALVRDPQFALAQRLDLAQNPAMGPLVNFLTQVMGLQGGEALATRGGSFFEEMAPLLGGAIGGIGGLIGAGLGSGLGINAQQQRGVNSALRSAQLFS